MVTLLLLRGTGDRTRRTFAVTGRNAVLARHRGYWWVLVSGFFEPLLYLASIGVGVGHLVGNVALPHGRTVTYAAFVAPAMLAWSAMNGTMSESTYQFYAKLREQKLFDAVLATPVTPFEVALGELVWSIVRGAIYAAVFLGIMVSVKLTTIVPALVALPATVLAGCAFGGLGCALATLARSWQDFDFISLALFAMLLFSGTFAQVDQYPVGMRLVVEALPLYHAVELIRGITTDTPLSGLLGHVVYLAATAVVGLTVAGRRMSALLCR